MPRLDLFRFEDRITPSNSPIFVSTTADSGVGSLRQAIIDANATAGNDIINFSITGTITLDSKNNTVIASLPTILNANANASGGGGTVGTLTIAGPGSSSLTISGLDGGNAARHFNIFNIATGGDLTISGVTVSGANTSGMGGPRQIGSAYGGGFINAGILTVNNSTISGNTANNGIGGSGSGSGGGIFNYNGILSVNNSTISGNTAGFLGGGIGNSFGGIVTVSNSILSGNTASIGGGGIENRGNLSVNNSTLSGNTASIGGGIYNNFTLTLINSTLSGNTASSQGGGIANYGTLTISNSTLSGNSAGTGGGIINGNGSGTLTISNSTLSGNTSRGSGGGISNFSTLNISNSTFSVNSAGFAGGGISNLSTLNISNSTLSGNTASSQGGGIYSSGTFTVTNSTISGNAASIGGGIYNAIIFNIANTIIANSTSGGDFAGTGPNTNTNNLVSDGTLPAGTNNKTGDPLLGPLANNGGPTQTLALLNGSPAIGVGDANISNASPVNGLDQRNYARSATTPSIGAFEYNGIGPTPTVISISPPTGSTVGGTAITITGADFTGATAVTIGGVAATNVTVFSSTIITATTPAHAAGTASVLVTTSSGTNAANTLFTYAAAPTPTPPNPTPTPTPTSTAPLVVGTPPTSSGGSSTVTIYDPITGQPTGTAVPFPGFTGSIHVASGDFNNDGVAELIAGAGFGGGPAIAILDSQTGEVMEAFFAFDSSFTGGVFVAVQDVNGDGILDIIAGAGPSGGPEVRIFDGRNLNVLRSFFAYAENFTGGVSVATIDFNHDGILDLVTGAGPGAAPHVKVFDGATGDILSQWYAYPISFTGGVYVAAGDIGNDGNIEVVTGPGAGGAPVVAVWDPNTGALLAQFYAYAEDFTGGVRVGVNDGNGDGIADIITGAGPGGAPEVKVFSFPALDLLFSFYSGDPANTGGVFVS